MGTLYNKETEWIASVAVCLKTVRMLRTNISDETMLETGLYLLYIAIYMYNLMLYPAKMFGVNENLSLTLQRQRHETPPTGGSQIGSMIRDVS